MKQLSLESKIKQIYDNPVGGDILDKLLLGLGKSKRWITNPIVSHIKLKYIKKLTKNRLSSSFYETFLQLLNEAEEKVMDQEGPIEHKWWKESIVYQIYPRSFKDSNGDGIGDIRGIIEKLDYLKELGVDVLWLSPIYDSPNDDNGYDIRDYYKIMNEFGTMEDFDELLKGVHSRGMKLIMDLVLNHTSDEHRWFKEALAHPDSPYRDYYYFRKSKKDGEPPNNWCSYFSGPAWVYYEKQDEWAMHLFSPKQMDLNWENEKLRKEIYQMINWWLEKGVDGFRLDVINYISKREGLPDGDEFIKQLMEYGGVEHYFYGPKLHNYLREMREETFSKYDVFAVGETPGIGVEMGKQLTASERKELDMFFSFDHLETPGHKRFEPYRYDLNYLKQFWIQSMRRYGSNCWPTLFLENHDNPRMISKVDPSPEYRVALGKMLGMLQLTLRGTPFIFQGQELGLINKDFRSIEEFRDIESINLYHELIKKMSKEEALKIILSGSRDHARTPMPWSNERYAGFMSQDGSKVTESFKAQIPWIGMDEDYKLYNVESELKDETSIYHFYRSLIQFRKKTPALIYGSFKVLDESVKDLFTYVRKLEGERYYIECNLSDHCIKRIKKITGFKRLLSNYKLPYDVLRPYEANLYQF